MRVHPWLRARRARARERRGAAAVEFAVTLPVIVMLLLGTIEYGNYFTELAIVNAVARDAARYGSNQATAAEAIAKAEAAADAMLATDLGYCGASSCTITVTTMELGGVGDVVEVRLDVEYNQLTGAVPFVAIPSMMRARAIYPIVDDY